MISSNSEKLNVETKRMWEKAADKYIKNCHKFEIKIDSSIVIALQTGYITTLMSYMILRCFVTVFLGTVISIIMNLWSHRWTILQPTKSFNEGAMLPLMDILEDNTHIKKLNLASSGMHDARYIVQVTQSIKFVAGW